MIHPKQYGKTTCVFFDPNILTASKSSFSFGYVNHAPGQLLSKSAHLSHAGPRKLTCARHCCGAGGVVSLLAGGNALELTSTPRPTAHCLVEDVVGAASMASRRQTTTQPHDFQSFSASCASASTDGIPSAQAALTAQPFPKKCERQTLKSGSPTSPRNWTCVLPFL